MKVTIRKTVHMLRYIHKMEYMEPICSAMLRYALLVPTVPSIPVRFNILTTDTPNPIILKKLRIHYNPLEQLRLY